ncbi:MAG TPA: ATP-binding protein, partial [Burkholderiales bacterium]|nr:ATP-binding protein [Burkholderiales bacterium]
LRPYSETLVDKLEEKNAELQETLRKLQAAHREIVALNRELELRVEQRTGELQEANRELESFSYWVSHDLRATLRAMAGFTSVVLRDHAGRLPLDATQLIARVEENVRGMAMLIDDLLDLARVGRKTLSPQRVNLAHVVRECLKELAHDQEGRAIDIAVGELPPCHGDLVLLKHVFANLLSNALKYTRKRQVARIEVGADTRNGQQLIFVRDNGAGFDTRHAHKLFEVFQRLHSQSEFPGTGVGLAIVKRAIEKHGGRVWAESAPDRGATFYLTLPAASPDVQPAR